MQSNDIGEHSFVLIKPDGIRRALVGQILARFERTGLTLLAMKMLNAGPRLAEEHYQEHQGKIFFDALVKMLCSAPVLALAVGGADAIAVVRKLVGETEPQKAAPGSIRGDFCHMGYARSKERLGVIPNLVHASDSPESAQRELALWFDPQEFVLPYERVDFLYF